MTLFEEDFPFEEIRDRNGDYFHGVQEAMNAGYGLKQVWSVTEGEGIYTYGPPRHYVNVIGYIATKEYHDNDTYYEEK